ncbi:hypothetical protein L198_03875 [Cryptococcus wingfieldii CBS 7118]|uniref:lytic cellulose monooxygenase (C4-dehydrogenating) n=1 Tax=Cryptococcus wingfieldii CBS 7118 TaxID=1295528 RepID=A0A1E3J8Y7_9TREE|nr:hypothetical protein L198_03875 [Cryptococcus wingfieldii CBS 7118]ODN97312.1 hypothetical protein L198_03875 [Cryptococcus wingfieldii CBS 7118]
MPSFLVNKVALATLAGLAALPSALAHGHVTSWQIGDTTYAGFNPSNSAELGSTPERATTNSDQGYADYTTDVVATGGTATSSDLVANATAGDTVIVTWNTWPESHKGPVTQWMAHCPDDLCAGTAGADMDWFKISQSSYDESSDSWPTDYIAKNLIWTFTLPTNLAAGQYLLRHELLAMHTTGAVSHFLPQFYPVAIEMQLESSGSTTPSPTGTFPDMYNSDDDMALTQNIYGGSALNAEFVVPGVAVYDGSDATVSNWDSTGLENDSTSSSSATASSAVSATTSSAGASATTSSAETLVETSAAESSIQSSAVETSAVETSAIETSAVETSAAATTTNAVSEAATSTCASASATASGASGTNLQTYTGAIDGISAPSVTADGDQYTCNGNTFNSKSDALTRSCDVQRNQCLDSANSKANDQVSAAMTACETQATECDASVSSARRRDMVIGRYAKRAF